LLWGNKKKLKKLSFPSAAPLEDFRMGTKWIFKGRKTKMVVKISQKHNSGHWVGQDCEEKCG